MKLNLVFIVRDERIRHRTERFGSYILACIIIIIIIIIIYLPEKIMTIEQ